MLMSKSRLEKFLYALYSIDSSDLPNPLSRIEELYKCLVTGEEVPSFKPTSRVEKYLMAILGGYDVDSLPNPLSRVEVLLYKLATGDDNLDDVKSFLSEHEELLAEIIRNGGVGGNIDIEYVLYTLTTKYSALYNTAEKPVKSAILKGNTLVNLSNNLTSSTTTLNFWYSNNLILEDISKLKRDTYYTVLYKLEDVSGNHDKYTDGEIGFGITGYAENMPRANTTTDITKTGDWCKIRFKIPSDFQSNYGVNANLYIRPIRAYTTPTEDDLIIYTINGFALLEGDYISNPIPFNEVFGGMKSVQMPVLTSSGKNLFNVELEQGSINTNNGTLIETMSAIRSKDFIKLSSNETFTISKSNGTQIITVVIYDKNYKFVRALWEQTFTLTGDEMYVKIADVENDLNNQYQIEKGKTPTSYEPYKSNILTTNEEVELRGIGDVQDTLNCLTGEVTQRIGEVILDGSEDWKQYRTMSDGSHNFICKKIDDVATSYGKIISNNLPIRTNLEDGVGLYLNDGRSKLELSFKDLSTIEEVKSYLNSNDVTIQYELATESIKTVDLSVVNQDGNSTKLKTFDDITHVTLYSEGLIPEAELEVATKNEEDLEDSSVYTVHTLSEEHNTLYNTAEKPVKSAILKGQTLVNLVNDVTSNEVGNYSNSPCKINVIRNLQNETLTIIFNVISLEIPDGADGTLRIGWGWSGQIRYQPTLGVNKVLYNYNQTSNSWLGVFSNSGAYNLGQRITISDVMVLEGDYTNIDIPYFEGMQSVKMPVLTTVGKNTFNIKNKGAWRSGWYSIPLEIPFNGEVYVKCADSLPSDFRINLLAINRNEHVLTSEEIKKGHTANYQNLTDIEFHCPSLSIEGDSRGILDDLVANGDIVIDVGGEPYKSNILTVNEEVELRGIGDVQDELNCLTGELTQRIGESNSENFAEHYYSMELFNGYCAAVIKLNNKNKALSSAIKTNLVPTTQSFSNGLDCGIYNNPDNVVVFKKGTSLEEFKNFVSNLIIQYQLETPTVKTVDLSVVDQDGKNTKLSTFNDITHVTLSSEGLIPEAELEVAEKVPEVAASMLTISREQEVINATTNEQSENVDATMIATTEIYEDLL